MCTSVERVFRPLPDGLFREIVLHFINFLNDDRTIRSSKLDKEIPGGLYKLASNDTEKSQHGEIMYTFPGASEPVRLLGLGEHYYENQRYGRS